MNFIQHTMCTHVLAAPPGVPIEECRALPIRRTAEALPGTDLLMPNVVSFWRPEPEELAAINAGHPIMLTIQGRTHPPLRMQVCAIKE